MDERDEGEHESLTDNLPSILTGWVGAFDESDGVHIGNAGNPLGLDGDLSDRVAECEDKI